MGSWILMAAFLAFRMLVPSVTHPLDYMIFVSAQDHLTCACRALPVRHWYDKSGWREEGREVALTYFSHWPEERFSKYNWRGS